jgi:hypothetical protein
MSNVATAQPFEAVHPTNSVPHEDVDSNEKKRNFEQINSDNTTPPETAEQAGIQPPAKRKRMTSKTMMIIYKPNETLLDIYKPGKIVKVFIQPKYLLHKDSALNKQVWGTDYYTDDSDIVAACQHASKFHPEDISKVHIRGAIVTIRICEPQKKYVSTFRNNIRSRSWNYSSEGDEASVHNSYTIESFRILYDKNMSSLSKLIQQGAAKPEKYVSVTERAQSILLKMNNNATENMEKLDAGIVGELEQYRFLPNTTIVFNLSNEPCLKYSLNSVADKGVDAKSCTSTRLQSGNEVMYLESFCNRYELNWNGTKFVLSRVNHPVTHNLSTANVPLDKSLATVVYDDLLWTEIQWGPSSVKIRSMELPIQTLQFYPKRP